MPETNLRPFQRRFVSAVERIGSGKVALSLPRGNGKSWLAGHLIARSMTVGDVLHVPGAENILLSGMFEQHGGAPAFAGGLGDAVVQLVGGAVEAEAPEVSRQRRQGCSVRGHRRTPGHGTGHRGLAVRVGRAALGDGMVP